MQSAIILKQHTHLVIAPGSLRPMHFCMGQDRQDGVLGLLCCTAMIRSPHWQQQSTERRAANARASILAASASVQAQGHAPASTELGSLTCHASQLLHIQQPGRLCSCCTHAISTAEGAVVGTSTSTLWCGTILAHKHLEHRSPWRHQGRNNGLRQ